MPKLDYFLIENCGLDGNLGKTGEGGNALATDILSGKTATTTLGYLTGTMTNNGTVSITPSTVSQSIAQGYHNGSGTVAGSSNLIAGNIKNGVSIFGVSGNLVPGTAISSGTAACGTGGDAYKYTVSLSFTPVFIYLVSDGYTNVIVYNNYYGYTSTTTYLQSGSVRTLSDHGGYVNSSGFCLYDYNNTGAACHWFAF